MDTTLSLVALIVAAVAAAVSALATVVAVRVAKKSNEDRWAFEWAGQRPVVYPLLSLDWLRGAGAYVNPLAMSGQACRGLLPLKNGGRGPALNVRLTVTSATGEYSSDVVVGTIGVGDLLDAQLAAPGIDKWSGATGTLSYTDLVEGGYEMPFTVSEDAGQLEVVVVGKVTHTRPQPASPAS
jgi:hypothetical protein